MRRKNLRKIVNLALVNAIRHVSFALLAGSGAVLFTAVAGCSDDDDQKSVVLLTAEQLRDPQACKDCHPDHVAQWSRSMHAYAAEDPVFLAMNKKGQRETNGALGTFCVNCHAPVAVLDKATTDGTNLAELPAWQRGITCYACHTVENVSELHNNNTRSNPTTLHGPLRDPTSGSPHTVKYSPLFDRTKHDSSSLCGSCHDVVTPFGAHVARTYSEWTESLFAKQEPGVQLTCGNCHMNASEGAAATVQGAPKREIHDHSLPAVSIPITEFTGTDILLSQVQEELNNSLIAKLCINPPMGGPNVDVSLDNAFAGHNFPSGSAYHRRVWVELVAYRDGDIVFSSGMVDDKTAIATLDDPQLWLMRDQLLDKNGDAASSLWTAYDSEGESLPPAVTNDPLDPAYYHAVTRSYTVPVDADRITMRVRYSTIGLEVIDELIASGDLDPALRDAAPIHELKSTKLAWTTADGFGCITVNK